MSLPPANSLPEELPLVVDTKDDGTVEVEFPIGWKELLVLWQALACCKRKHLQVMRVKGKVVTTVSDTEVRDLLQKMDDLVKEMY